MRCVFEKALDGSSALLLFSSSPNQYNVLTAARGRIFEFEFEQDKLRAVLKMVSELNSLRD